MGVEQLSRRRQPTAAQNYNRRIALNLASQLPEATSDALEVVSFMRELIGFLSPDQAIFSGNADLISANLVTNLPESPASLPK